MGSFDFRFVVQRMASSSCLRVVRVLRVLDAQLNGTDDGDVMVADGDLMVKPGGDLVVTW